MTMSASLPSWSSTSANRREATISPGLGGSGPLVSTRREGAASWLSGQSHPSAA